MPLMVVQPFRVKPKVAALIKSVDMSPLVFVPLLYGQLALLSCSHASTIRDLDGEGSLRNCSGGGSTKHALCTKCEPARRIGHRRPPVSGRTTLGRKGKCIRLSMSGRRERSCRSNGQI